MRQILAYMKLGMFVNIAMSMTMIFGSLAMTHVKEAFAANLRSVSMVEEDVIRASDLFDGLLENADRVVGPAPAPGHDMTINSRTLLRISMALDLPWRPQSGREYVVVKRAATIIEPDTIRSALREQINAQGFSKLYDLSFEYGLEKIALPQNSARTMEISTFDLDPVSGVFQAVILAPDAQNPIVRKEISGKAQRLVQVPVLKKAVQNGSVINANNIEFITMPDYQIQHNIILSAQNLEGMTPRRIAMPGQPLRQNEIQEPIMVRRGDNVIITYRDGAIELIAEGKALENGARGERIRVVNYSSNRTLDAFITGQSRVEIN